MPPVAEVNYWSVWIFLKKSNDFNIYQHVFIIRLFPTIEMDIGVWILSKLTDKNREDIINGWIAEDMQYIVIWFGNLMMLSLVALSGFGLFVIEIYDGNRKISYPMVLRDPLIAIEAPIINSISSKPFWNPSYPLDHTLKV